MRVSAPDVLVGIIVIAAAAATPQDSPAPIDATVTVRLAAGKTTYAIGELIPLELEFRGRAEPDYYFWTGTYDRRGRMIYERYDVAPGNGNDDPLAEFFGAFGGPGGGLGGWQPTWANRFPRGFSGTCRACARFSTCRWPGVIRGCGWTD